VDQTPTSFEVVELRHGDHTVPFDYRIIAKRIGFEQVRLAEVKDVQTAHVPDGQPRHGPSLPTEKQNASAVRLGSRAPAGGEGPGAANLGSGTLPLLMLGGLGVVGYAWRRRKKVA